jgi:hypothetical protein
MNQDSAKQDKLSEQLITKTPEIRALCLPGTGDSKAYSDSKAALVRYTNTNSIKTEGFVLSDDWKQGPDANDPGTGATWEVCVESSTLDIGSLDPFVFRILKPQDAGYGVCVGTPDNLQGCFSDLETFVQAKQYHLVAPPRYKIKSVDNLSKRKVYEIWMPVAPTTLKLAKPQAEQPK